MLYYDFQTLFGLSAQDASDLYFAGFALVVGPYVLGWMIRVAVQLIKTL